MNVADETSDTEQRKDRQQYYPGDIVWDTHSSEVTPEQTAAVLKDQEDRRKAAMRGRVAEAVKNRLNQTPS